MDQTHYASKGFDEKHWLLGSIARLDYLLTTCSYISQVSFCIIQSALLDL